MAEKIFKFEMRQRVKGTFAGVPFVGMVITRMESHTAGLHYAVHGDAPFKGGESSQWFSESELQPA